MLVLNGIYFIVEREPEERSLEKYFFRNEKMIFLGTKPKRIPIVKESPNSVVVYYTMTRIWLLKVRMRIVLCHNMVGVAGALVMSTMHEKILDLHNTRKFESSFRYLTITMTKSEIIDMDSINYLNYATQLFGKLFSR